MPHFLRGFGFLFYTLLSTISLAQVNLSGKVVEEKSMEPLPFATVMISGTTKGTVTNVDGFFSILGIHSDTVSLVVSYVGYEALVVDVDVKKMQGLIIVKLLPLTSQLQEVVISANAYKIMSASSGVSVVSLSPRQLSLLPSIGETDIFRSLQLLPGVSGTNESSSGLYVRGGTPDQNLVLLDGMTVYKVDHFYGFFSAFNSNAIKDVQLYKGAFPAKYGGRLSSVVDMTGKTGSFENFRGGVNLNLLSVGAYLEIPLFNKFSLFFAGRRSFTDVLQSGLYNSITDKITGDGSIPGLDDRFNVTTLEPTFYFYDWNSKISYKPSEKDIISLSFYSGKDYLDKSRTIDRALTDDIFVDARIDEKTDWGNLGVSGKWSRQWGPKLYTSLLFTGSEYFSKYDRNGFLEISIPSEDSILFSGSQNTFEDNKVRDLTFRWDGEWQFATSHKLDFGISTTQTDIHYLSTRNDTTTILARDQLANYSSIYFSENWKPGEGVSFSAGLRISNYEYSSDLLIEPRLSIIYNLTSKLKLKGAYGEHYQFVNRIINENISEGSREFWLLADGDQVKISNAKHYVAGIAYELDRWLFDIEGYYKPMEGLSEFSLRFRRGIEIDADELFFTGNGIAKGIEFLIQKKQGIYTGWVSYTLGQVMHTFDAFNDGEEFPALHDQLHELKLVNSYEINEWTFAATFIYGSGKPFSEPEGQYSTKLLDGRTFNYVAIGSKNGSRLPPYQRLDLSAHLKLPFEKVTMDIGVSIFNFFNRKNVWYYEYDFSQDPVLTTEVNYLGFTPNVSLTLAF
jgi:hypothetical protein